MVFRALRFVSIALLVSLWAPRPAGAFDTFWHSAATGKATQGDGFTDDATNVVQFGNFSGPDFFGPLYDVVLGEKLEKLDKKHGDALNAALGLRNDGKSAKVRHAAIYLHFDSLDGKLDSNAKFDYLFLRLLANTRAALAYWDGAGLPESERRIVVLMTLGISLHMVQDFYAHSDWVHNDFDKLGVPVVATGWGKDRAPTWFEVRSKLGDPASWSFKVQTGIYPPPKDPKDKRSHTHLNHDNSQLFYDGESQQPWHAEGAYPAKDDKTATEHQLFSANSAAGASIEWLRLLELDPAAKAAIDGAKTWKYKHPLAAPDQLAGSLALTLLLSCAPGHWDGKNPPKSRVAQCRAIYTMAGFAMAAFYNEFWAQHIKHDLLARLVDGFGDLVGKGYQFDAEWVKTHFPDGPEGAQH